MTRFPTPLSPTAQKIPSSGDQQTASQLFVFGVVRSFQSFPLVEVITLDKEPVEETATKTPSSGDHETECHESFAALARTVQVIPSGEVWTRLPVPLLPTATKRLKAGAQQIENSVLAAAAARCVQLSPSGEVMTRPSEPTAQNIPNSGDQQTPRKALMGAGCDVQVRPSGLVDAKKPDDATAANNPSCGDHATDCQAFPAEGVFFVQLIPSGELRLEFAAAPSVTNNPSCGDQAMHNPPLVPTGAARGVHVTASGEVMIRLTPPEEFTAANNRKAGDQATPIQLWSAALVCGVQTDTRLLATRVRAALHKSEVRSRRLCEWVAG